MAIIVSCTCGKQFKVKDELAGKRGKCAACGRVTTVPIPAPSVDLEKASPARVCPTCDESLAPNAVICVHCGLDLRTGKQLAKAKPTASPDGSITSAKAPATSSRLWIALVAGGGFCVAGVVAAILFFAWGRGTGVQGIAQQPNPNVTTKKDVNIAQQPNPNVTMNLSFEEAFLTGQIAWQGVKNTQLTTKSGGQQKVENTEFAMKFKYDPNGKRSIDETGYKTYIWPDREAIFGPGAVIRLSQNLTVREGTIQAGDEWTWTGQQWIASRNLPGFKGTTDLVNNTPDSKKPSAKAPDVNSENLAVKKLIAKVRGVTPENVALYEKFLREPSASNAFFYLGTLPYTGDDVRDVIKVGLEKPAIAALIQLIQEKKNSSDKADLLMCGQSIKALGQFGPHAREVIPLLAELQTSRDNAVGSSAKLAIASINGKQ